MTVSRLYRHKPRSREQEPFYRRSVEKRAVTNEEVRPWATDTALSTGLKRQE